MTFKKDYNDMLLYLLRELVRNALHFEEIVTGSVSGLTHIDVKVEDLYNKVINDIRPLYLFSNLHNSDFDSSLFYFVQAQEHEIYDLQPFFTSSLFSRANFVLDEERGVIIHHLAS